MIWPSGISSSPHTNRFDGSTDDTTLRDLSYVRLEERGVAAEVALGRRTLRFNGLGEWS